MGTAIISMQQRHSLQESQISHKKLGTSSLFCCLTPNRYLFDQRGMLTHIQIHVISCLIQSCMCVAFFDMSTQYIIKLLILLDLFGDMGDWFG